MEESSPVFCVTENEMGCMLYVIENMAKKWHEKIGNDTKWFNCFQLNLRAKIKMQNYSLASKYCALEIESFA